MAKSQPNRSTAPVSHYHQVQAEFTAAVVVKCHNLIRDKHSRSSDCHYFKYDFCTLFSLCN